MSIIHAVDTMPTGRRPVVYLPTLRSAGHRLPILKNHEARLSWGGREKIRTLENEDLEASYLI